jgi:hypothetical protein
MTSTTRVLKMRPLTLKMQQILAAVDATPTAQSVIYDRLGYAQGVGAILVALQARGLIENVGPFEWQKGSEV